MTESAGATIDDPTSDERWQAGLDYAMEQFCHVLRVDPKDVTKVAEDLKITKETPPTFIVMTQDDGIKVENAYVYGLALKAVKVPAEIHVFAKGGHGYGLRPTENPVTKWPELATQWMKTIGWIK